MKVSLIVLIGRVESEGQRAYITCVAGFILDKTIGVNCPKRIENAKILIANTCEHPQLFFLAINMC